MFETCETYNNSCIKNHKNNVTDLLK